MDMEDLGLQKMQEIQRQLQEKYKDRWSPLTPELGKQLMHKHHEESIQNMQKVFAAKTF